MSTIEIRLARRLARHMVPVAGGLVLLATAVAAQPLPRIDGALTMEQGVDLAREKNLRVKAADADARTMDSMRREALAPFWPQLSANGYFNDQRMAPNVFTSAGNTMARNYQVFNADQTRDANVTAMYSLFAGGRDYYGYKAATARADAARQMFRGAEVDVAMQARLDYIAALREAENLRVTGELVRDIEERCPSKKGSVRRAKCTRRSRPRSSSERPPRPRYGPPTATTSHRWR